MAWDNEMIPREHFQGMANRGEVVSFPAGHGGIIHEVGGLLERNAMTASALAGKLRVDTRTVMNAIAHLRHRYRRRISRYYNPADRKYYYLMQKSEGR